MVKNKREHETLFDYKLRLFQNRKEYELSWEEVGDLIRKYYPHFKDTGDHLRKKSYGYLEAIQDQKIKIFNKTVMVMNDLHLPHERYDVISSIQKHADEIDILVLAGDIMDCASISSWDKLDALPLTAELAYTHKFLKKISKILDGKRIIMLRGNHEERLHRDISRMNQKELIPLINPEILEMFIDGFHLYSDGKKVKYEPIPNLEYVPHWYFTMDNIIYAHPKSFSKVKGKMTSNIVEYFINRLVDFDLVIFGHTHKFCFSRVEGQMSKLSLENFSMCLDADYADTGKLSYTPQSSGYSIISYNEGERVTQEGIKMYLLD